MGTVGRKSISTLSNYLLSINKDTITLSSTLSKITTTMGNTVRWGITASIFQGIMSSISGAVSYVKELDESLTQIQMVSQSSAASMRELAQYANEAAQSLATSTVDYTNAVKIFTQEGFNLEDSKLQADLSVKLANVSEQDTSTTADQITAYRNAFGLSIDEMSSSLDKLANVANNTAANVGELMTAAQRSASVASAVGATEDSFIASVATIQSVTRQSSEEIGNGLKTIMQRFADIKTNGESSEGGDSVDYGEYAQALKSVGVDVLDENGAYKGFDQIITELQDVWGSLSDTMKIAVGEKVAGKFQYNRFAALMDHPDYYEKAYSATQDADGAMDTMQETYADSIAGRLKTLQAAGEQVITTLFNQDAVEPILGDITKLVNGLNEIVETAGGLSGVLESLGAVFLRIFGNQLSGQINNIANAISKIFIQSRSAKNVENLFQLFGFNSLSSESHTLTSKFGTDAAKIYGNLSGESQKQVQAYSEQLLVLEQEHEQILEQEKAIEIEITDQINNQIAANKDKIKQNTEQIKENENTILNGKTVSKNSVGGYTKAYNQADTAYQESLTKEIQYRQEASNATNEAAEAAVKLETVEKEINALLKQGVAEDDARLEEKQAELFCLQDTYETESRTADALRQKLVLQEKITAQRKQEKEQAKEKLDSAKETLALKEQNKELKEQNDLLSQQSSKFQKICKKIQEGKTLNDKELQTLREIRNSLSENSSLMNQFNTIVEKAGISWEKVEQAEQRSADLIKTMKMEALVSSASRLVSNFVSIAFAVDMITEAIEIWTDDSLSLEDKISQGLLPTLMGISMILPVVVDAFKALRAAKEADQAVTSANILVNWLYVASLKAVEKAERKVGETAPIAAVGEAAIGEEAAVASVETAALSGSLDALKAALSGFAELFVAFLPEILAAATAFAVVAAVVMAVKENIELYTQSQYDVAGALEKSNEALQNYNSILDDTTSTLNSVDTAIQQLADDEDAFDGLTKGSEEFSDALQQSQTDAWNFYNTYKDLLSGFDGQIFETGNNGELTINADAQAYVKKKQAEKVNLAQALVTSEQIKNNELKVDNSAKAITDKVTGNADLSYGYGQSGKAVKASTESSINEYTEALGSFIASSNKGFTSIEEAIKAYDETIDNADTVINGSKSNTQKVKDYLKTEGNKEGSTLLADLISIGQQNNTTNNQSKELKDTLYKTTASNNEVYTKASSKVQDVAINILKGNSELYANQAKEEYNNMSSSDKDSKYEELTGYYKDGDKWYTDKDKTEEIDVSSEDIKSAILSALEQEKVEDNTDSAVKTAQKLGVSNFTDDQLAAVQAYAENEQIEINGELQSFADYMSGQGYTSLEAFCQALSEGAVSVEGFANAADKYSYAQSFGELDTLYADSDKTKDDKSGYESKLSKMQSSAAQKYDLDVEDITDQAEALADAYDLAAGAASELAIQNQRMNKGVETLAGSWDDWRDILENSDDTAIDYIDTVQDVTKCIANLVGTSEDLDLSKSFLKDADNLALIEKAAQGDEDAIIQLGYAVGKDLVDSMEISSSMTDILKKGMAELEESGEKLDPSSTLGKLNTAIQNFDINKQNVIDGLNQISTAGLAVGDSVANAFSDETAYNDWVNSLNQMALATNMTVDEMNNLLSSVNMTANVTVKEQTVSTKVPIYTEHVEVTPSDQTLTDGTVVSAYDKHSYTSITGYKDVDETLQVAQLGTDGDPGSANVRFIGNGSVGSSNKSSGGSSGGGGGGGSSKKKRTASANKNSRDVYKEVHNKQDRQNAILNKQNELNDELYGASKIKNLKAVIDSHRELADLYQEELDIQKQQIEMQKNQSADEYGNLTVKGLADTVGITIEYNEDGDITNGKAIQDAIYARYKSAYDTETAHSDEDDYSWYTEQTEYWEDILDQWTEAEDAYGDMLDNQDELEATIREEVDNIQESNNELIETGFDLIDTMTDLIDTITDMKQTYNDFIYGENETGASEANAQDAEEAIDKYFGGENHKIELSSEGIDSAVSDYVAYAAKNQNNTARSAESIIGDEEESYFGTGSNNLVQDAINGAIQAIGISKGIREGTDNALTADQAAELRQTALDKLSDVQSQLISYYEQIEEALQNNLEDFQDAIDEGLDGFDTELDKIDTLMSINNIANGEDSHAGREGRIALYGAQQDVYSNKLDFINKSLEEAQKKREELKKQQEDLVAQGKDTNSLQQSIKEQDETIADLEQQQLETTEQLLEAYQSQYQEKATQEITDYVNQLLGGGSTNGPDDAVYMAQLDWELSSDEDSMHLDAYDKAAEIQKLQYKYQELLNDTSSVNAETQAKISAQMNEQLSLLRDKTKLTQYDVDYANQQLTILQKQIALEDAQANKSQMRLMRDASGNYSYTYVADEEDVLSKQTELLEAEQEAYDMSRDALAESQENEINTLVETKDKLIEIMTDTSLSAKDQKEAISKVLGHLNTEMGELSDQVTVRTANTVTEFADLAKTVTEENLGDTSKMVEQAAAGQTEVLDAVQARFATFSEYSENLIDTAEMKAGITALESDLDNMIDDYRKAVAAAGSSNETTGQIIAQQWDTITQNIKKASDEIRDNYMEAMETTSKGITTFLQELAKYSDITITLKSINALAEGISAESNTAVSAATGGYTGEWANGSTDGKLAWLHQKELILNEDDTKNILSAVETMRLLASGGMSTFTNLSQISSNSGDTIEQRVEITADFPNVSSSSEIEDALLNLADNAYQLAHRNY